MPSTLCNPKLIDDFLAERLTDEQRKEFEQHLDECDACCAALQLQTADVTLWNDAKNYLSTVSDLCDVASDEMPASSDVPRLDFLNPTDDPHMLGRFAGYEISGVIGCGGMGIVLKGFDSALNRYAAIKVLSPHYASSGAARQRFAREAQAAAAVVHENVISIHGVDEFNGLPYLVMPYVKGQSLHKRIQSSGPLSVPEILRIGLQTARGLSAAHDQGLVHRDIKPGNILLPVNVERVIITDFGLARAADDASLTRSGVIAGTPQYMSPEQAKGEAIDHRSDLFSLGSMMYAMCTGHAPFRAETPYGILRRITDNEARPIRDINADIPPWLDGIIQKLLSKSVNDRYSTAAEVADLLEDCLAHVQHPTQVPLPTSAAQTQQPTGVRKFNKTLAVAAGVCLCLLGADAIYRQTTLPRVDTTQEISTDGAVAAVNVTESSSNPNPDPSESNATLPSVTPENSDLQWEPFDGLDQLEATLNDLNQSYSDV